MSNTTRRLLVWTALVLFSLAPAGRAANAGESIGSPDYRIGPEDVVQVVVWKNEALSHTVPVRPDGQISLPLLNDVQAAGLTPLELRESLIKRLSDYVPAPEVSVIVTEVKSMKISVMGAVAKPGRYQLGSSATVIDALAMAEGFTEFSSPSRIVVLRSKGNRQERLPFDYDKFRSGSGGVQANFDLRPGDIVLVP